MEVGAVKQAFNNEVIQLKKNLNQAKIQIIHKLTRKAKTLTEKKTPDHLKEKNKRKAESAVKEVLLMKKLKPRDIARFIITYKGDLNSHLNKPTVDSDKACARLLLHKALQHKYKTIKEKFGDVPIKDLLMSRQERLKLKKEAKDAQKNKKKGKQGKVINSEGDWNVEDVKMDKGKKEISQNDDGSDDESQGDDVSNDVNEKDDSEGQIENVSDNNGPDEEDEDVSNQKIRSADVSDSDDDIPINRQVVNGSDESSVDKEMESDEESVADDSDIENMEKEESADGGSQNDSDEEMMDTVIPSPAKQKKPLKTPKLLMPKPTEKIKSNIEEVLLNLKPKNKTDKKAKDNKNKNLNEKMLNRKFKKDDNDNLHVEKVVDPFFKTATGESYMSVAEPRQPDEIKEVHRQGNRQERRAAMFGRAPIRPRRDDRQNFRSNNRNRDGPESNGRNNKFDRKDKSTKFNDRNTFNDRNSNSSDRNSKFNANSSNINDRNSNFNDKNSNFNDRKSNFNDNRNSNYSNNKFNNKTTEPKEQKLHPSWEAKKKQSGILPFQGKKIVFDES